MVGRVQIHLRSIHCVPIAKLRYEVASMEGRLFGPMGPAHQLAKHFPHDGSQISRIVYPSVVGTPPGQSHGLYCLLQSLQLIVVEPFMPFPGIEMGQAFE